MAETESLARVIVCDAGPLIHLDELRCLDLLSDFTRVLIPPTVWSEFDRHRPGATAVPGIPFEKVAVGAALPEDLAALARLLVLDAGEIEVLQAVREHGADLLLTDDTAARLAARNLSVPVHGTLGVLLRAVRRQQRTPAETIETLQKLPTVSTLHVRRSLLDEIIRQVNESAG
jgi:predicted nucleic acid-binding protein